MRKSGPVKKHAGYTCTPDGEILVHPRNVTDIDALDGVRGCICTVTRHVGVDN